MRQILNQIITSQLLLAALIYAAPGIQSSAIGSPQSDSSLLALDSPALKVISDDDQANLQFIKHHIGNDFSEFKQINEVHAFLDRVKLLVQKHPKNVAFAQGELKELFKFLSQEIVTKLIRVDTEPFIMPLNDDRIPFAQRAIDEDELIRKLFGGPMRSLIEMRKQQSRGHDEGNHKDGNFFANFWCKISGGCNN